MKSFKQQIEKLVKSSKAYQEIINEDEDVTLGIIDKCLNEHVEETSKKLLEDKE